MLREPCISYIFFQLHSVLREFKLSIYSEISFRINLFFLIEPKFKATLDWTDHVSHLAMVLQCKSYYIEALILQCDRQFGSHESSNFIMRYFSPTKLIEATPIEVWFPIYCNNCFISTSKTGTLISHGCLLDVFVACCAERSPFGQSSLVVMSSCKFFTYSDTYFNKI